MCSYKNLGFPEKDDILFFDNPESHLTTETFSGINEMNLYSDCYKIASLKLFENCDGSRFSKNSIVYTLIFLNRHFLELRLKEIIGYLNYIESGKNKFDINNKLRHELLPLWNKFINLVKKVEPTLYDKKESQQVEKLIKEFHVKDENSFTYRYPVDKEYKPSFEPEYIDLGNFMIIMCKLYNYFDNIAISLICIIDEKKNYAEYSNYYNPDETHN